MDEENQESSEVVLPLWPKSGEEWGYLAMDLGSLGMIFASVWSECPEIPDHMAFIYSFSIVGVVMGLIRFVFSLRREGNDKLYSIPAVIATVLGMAQLGLGIWGMVLVFPNLKYFSDPSPETCETGPMVAMAIPAFIIALVLVGIIFYGIYQAVMPKKEEEESGDA